MTPMASNTRMIPIAAIISSRVNPRRAVADGTAGAGVRVKSRM
jgi:hypothetical protein